MKAPMSTPSGVSRFSERLRHPWSHPGSEVDSDSRKHLPMLMPPRQRRLPANIAEFLLVFRLRARRRATSSPDVLDRAVRVVCVTCEHWFGASDQPRYRPRHND